MFVPTPSSVWREALLFVSARSQRKWGFLRNQYPPGFLCSSSVDWRRFAAACCCSCRYCCWRHGDIILLWEQELLFVDNQVIRARVYTLAVSEAWVFCLYIHFLQFIVTPLPILIFLILLFWVRTLSFFGLRESFCCYRSTGVFLQKWQQVNQALLFNFSYYLQACEGEEGKGRRQSSSSSRCTVWGRKWGGSRHVLEEDMQPNSRDIVPKHSFLTIAAG